MSDKLQKIGIVFLIVSLVLLFLESFTLCYISLGVVLAIDLWLERKKKLLLSGIGLNYLN